MAVLVCFLAVLVCDLFGVWPFWFMAILDITLALYPSEDVAMYLSRFIQVL